MTKPEIDFLAEVLRKIKALPTVDVVDVIHCVDCRYWQEAYAMQGICKCWDAETDDDDFCSRGEKRGVDEAVG